MSVVEHYGSPGAWAEGADPAYEMLSRAIVAASPVPLTGRLVADLGAGTGATSRAIAAVGGRPIEVDLSAPMLGYNRSARPVAVIADMSSLPFGDRVVGGVVAAFSLSHVEDPRAVLVEAMRVTSVGGPVVAGVFADTGVRHPIAGIVDRAASRHGFAPPEWYLHIKRNLEPRVADADSLRGLAIGAGLAEIGVTVTEVDAGLNTVAALIRWRLSTPVMAAFVAGLDNGERDAMYDEVVQEVGTETQPFRPAVRILSSVVPATR